MEGAKDTIKEYLDSLNLPLQTFNDRLEFENEFDLILNNILMNSLK